jgi:protein-L-isoaspartate(D-aspartate) O-methyltransferase
VTSDIDYRMWTTDPATGDLIPQRTSRTVIAEMVRLADVQAGMRVLEIGTGSGYTAAVLAKAVGPTGRVVSVDVDAGLVARATELHRTAGNAQVDIHVADGAHGWKAGAPYDRVLGWTTPHVVPEEWVWQAAPGAIVVTPVKIKDIAVAHAVIRCRVEQGEPTAATLHQGSFIEMTPEPINDFGQPRRYVVCAIGRGSGERAWLSVSGMHDTSSSQWEPLIRQLAAAEPEPGWIDPAHWRDFTTFLLCAVSDVPLISASTGAHWGFGLTYANGADSSTTDNNGAAAVLSDGALVACGDTVARERLREVRDAWEQAGKPGYDAAVVTFERDRDGWRAVGRYAVNNYQQAR